MAVDFTPAWMDEQLHAWRATVIRFIENEMAPEDAAARQRGHVDPVLWRRAGALGLLCADIPDEYGGAGGDFRHEAVFHEEMARRGLTGMNAAVHSIVAHYLLNHGTEAQKSQWLPRLARGEVIGAIAMTEPDAGSDLQAIRTRADRHDNGYRINGAKTYISNGFLAGLVLVVCKTNSTEKARGMSIMLVETRALPGFQVGPLLGKIGLHAQDTAELFFDDVFVDADCLLGGVEGQGFFQLMSDLAYERVLIGVSAIAAMEGAYQATLTYSRERQAFGQPIGQFQHSRFKLAEIATHIKVARTFLDRCITELVGGQLDTVGASMLKYWSTDLQCKVIDDCLQLFGGYGYMSESLIGRMYIDARIQRIYGGTNEIMKEVIARGL